MRGLARISEAASLAIHASVVLASDPDRLFTAHEIAEGLGVSVNHLAKVIQRLEKAGYLESVRGRAGGVRLSAKGRRSVLLDLYEAIEGPFEIRGCLLDRPQCPARDCGLGKLLKRTAEDLSAYLSQTKPGDVAKAGRTG